MYKEIQMNRLNWTGHQMTIGFTYLQEHDVVIICPVVVQVVDQGSGDIKHLLHSLFLEQIVLTQDYFDQIVPADQRCYLLVQSSNASHFQDVS